MKNLRPLITILIFISSCLSYAAARTPLSLNEECKQFVKSIEQTHNYGWLDVAETPQNLNQISIFYYFSKTASLIDPVIFFNGGPGFSSHTNYKTYEYQKDKYSKDKATSIDLIFMDQRGTGCSAAFPKGFEPRDIEKLKWYGSAGIVQDAEALRRHLIDDRKWKIFGQSFGGHVVHRYIEMFPESILKAYAHGYAIGQADFDTSYSRVAGHNQVLESYYKIYPLDQNRLIILNTYLSDQKKCFPKGETEVCGFEILYSLVQKIGFRTNWGLLHNTLERLVPKEKIAENEILRFVEEIPNPTNYHKTQALPKNYFSQHSAALNFIGIYDSNTTPMDYEKCLAIYSKMQTELNVKVGESLLDECKAPFQFNYKDLVKPVILTKVPMFAPNYVQLDRIKSNLIKFNIPFFLYSGDHDSFVPKILFQKEVKFLGSLINYTNFPDSGHEGCMTEKQIILNLNE